MRKCALHAVIILCLMVLLPLSSRTTAQAAPGDFILQWGARHHFEYPLGIARDKDGNIYVLDHGWFNEGYFHFVQVFNSAGERLRTWGSFGDGDGLFDAPTAIAVDQGGNVYVADANQESIQVFDSAGNFIRRWGSFGTDDGQFDVPLAVAVDSSGNVYVADSNNNRIQVFDSAGRFLRKWGSYGSGDGQFNYPTGLALDGTGILYVVDSGNQRVQVFDSAGNFIRKWGSQGEGDGQFKVPLAITVDGSGKAYVTDSASEVIEVFDSTGNFIGKWGEFGTDHGQFNGPSRIVAGTNGKIYVADGYNNRVQIFDTAGNFLENWWSYGSGDGEFNYLHQAAVDANGDVYVADTNNHRIEVFSGTGTFLRKWGSEGSGDGQLQWPSSIALDGKGNVYVADPSNSRIQVFDSTGKFMRKWPASNPSGLAVDPSGNIWTIDPEYPGSTVYVYDNSGNVIRQWDLDYYLVGIAIDASGIVYLLGSPNQVNVYDSTGNLIRQIWVPTNNVSGVAVDASGNVFVTTPSNSSGGTDSLYVFDSKGTLRGTWGGFGETNGLFFYPTAVALDPSGARVFVSDTGNNRIQVLEGYGGQLPPGWTGRDIGSVGVAGRASYGNGTFTLQGSGANIRGRADAFHYAYKPLDGDGQIVARVASVQNTNGHARGGVMIRETLAPDSRHAMVDIMATRGAEFSRRRITGGTTRATVRPGISAPYWVKLVRKGNIFRGYISKNGVRWTLVGRATIKMASSVYIGLIVNSRNNSELCTATMDGVSLSGQTDTPTVTTSAPTDGTPYNAPPQ